MTVPAALTIPSMLDTLHVDAVSLTEHLPGPGLSGRTVVHIVVNVMAADGAALTGLSKDAFSLRVVAGPGEGRRIAAMGCRESAPGIYTLSLGHASDVAHGPVMLAVFVHDQNADREGRRLVRIDP
jgi:hypothetical protein